MRDCPRCGGEVEASFRYCPWCAEPQRLKLVEFFPGRDRGKALRVSRYLAPGLEERHVRFSVWHEEGEEARAEAAVSLDDAETRRLAGFLRDTEPRGRPARQAPILDQLRLYIRSLR
jgi:hypothetical protein